MSLPPPTVEEFEEFRNNLLLGYSTVAAYLTAAEHPEQYDAIVDNTPPAELIHALCLAAATIANTIVGPHDDDCQCPTSSTQVIDQLREELIASRLEDWES
jgi:hypothetical protein